MICTGTVLLGTRGQKGQRVVADAREQVEDALTRMISIGDPPAFRHVPRAPHATGEGISEIDAMLTANHPIILSEQQFDPTFSAWSTHLAHATEAFHIESLRDRRPQFVIGTPRRRREGGRGQNRHIGEALPPRRERARQATVAPFLDRDSQALVRVWTTSHNQPSRRYPIKPPELQLIG
jgi:hypothetical protein